MNAEGAESLQSLDDIELCRFVSWVETATRRLENLEEGVDIVERVCEGAQGAQEVMRNAIDVAEYIESVASVVPLAGALVSVTLRLGKTALQQMERMQKSNEIRLYFKTAVGNLVVWLPRDFKLIFEIVDGLEEGGDTEKSKYLSAKHITAERKTSSLRRFFWAKRDADTLRGVRGEFDEAAGFFRVAIQEATREKTYEVERKVSLLRRKVEDLERKQGRGELVGLLSYASLSVL
uniref:Uncharacterized protein n=1 Tax=Chromera velia CCMP2878 TaxID=1169474 RepID=A0A0G4FWR0_9ALVE|eukprot:Cvel_19050.t1-p1 / transcript=Cvel_19050.t1 / gene=Cvel_19050 / organism=Chromera_velia_CCMP2878 / gene_product=hypothetical protein / transcript_product=hypothetical protein / location=Cvel_scaffold1615:26614-27839(-) / protein_length=234 / sequence_SO=supercontig / SO=protein_coding / is_pseudo=false